MNPHFSPESREYEIVGCAMRTANLQCAGLFRCARRTLRLLCVSLYLATAADHVSVVAAPWVLLMRQPRLR
jgi:hypothetical protein